MKHVVTIAELHKLIPQTRELEGINFKDMKGLLIAVIEKIEKSKNWEYVQYITGTPSLFVVKEKEYEAQPAPKYSNMFEETMQHYNTPATPDKPSRKKVENKNSSPSQEQKKEEQKEEIPLYDGTSIFPTTKMPW